jgi:S-adenosylmethionine hydrolase
LGFVDLRLVVLAGETNWDSLSTIYRLFAYSPWVTFFNFIGLMEIAINSGSAAQLLNLQRNDKVIFRFGDDD